MFASYDPAVFLIRQPNLGEPTVPAGERHGSKGERVAGPDSVKTDSDAVWKDGRSARFPGHFLCQFRRLTWLALSDFAVILVTPGFQVSACRTVLSAETRIGQGPGRLAPALNGVQRVVSSKLPVPTNKINKVTTIYRVRISTPESGLRGSEAQKFQGEGRSPP